MKMIFGLQARNLVSTELLHPHIVLQPSVASPRQDWTSKLFRFRNSNNASAIEFALPSLNGTSPRNVDKTFPMLVLKYRITTDSCFSVVMSVLSSMMREYWLVPMSLIKSAWKTGPITPRIRAVHFVLCKLMGFCTIAAD